MIYICLHTRPHAPRAASPLADAVLGGPSLHQGGHARDGIVALCVVGVMCVGDCVCVFFLFHFVCVWGGKGVLGLV
jgi:hypothetical protein